MSNTSLKSFFSLLALSITMIGCGGQASTGSPSNDPLPIGIQDNSIGVRTGNGIEFFSIVRILLNDELVDPLQNTVSVNSSDLISCEAELSEAFADSEADIVFEVVATNPDSKEQVVYINDVYWKQVGYDLQSKSAEVHCMATAYNEHGDLIDQMSSEVFTFESDRFKGSSSLDPLSNNNAPVYQIDRSSR